MVNYPVRACVLTLAIIHFLLGLARADLKGSTGLIAQPASTNRTILAPPLTFAPQSPSPTALQEILYAFQRNDETNGLRLLADVKVSMDAVEFNGYPILFAGISDWGTNFFEALLQRGASPNIRSRDGDFALTYAIERREWHKALRLIETGANTHVTNASLTTPFSALANHWTQWDKQSSDQTALLNHLFDSGYHPFTAVDRNGLSLLESIVEKSPAFASFLLSNNPDIHIRTAAGNNALHLAANFATTNELDALLKAGFPIDEPNADGLTALQLAAGNRDPVPFRVSTVDTAIGNFLIDHGASLDVFSAATFSKTNELMTLLKANPAAANSRDSFGRTPLHYAISATNSAVADLLLRSGADVNAKTTKAVRRLGTEVISSGSTPLHLASRGNLAVMVKRLLIAGASVDISDQNGNTALHFAAGQSQTNLTALLLKNHASVNVTNTAGKSPLWIAVETGSKPVVQALLKAGASTKILCDDTTLLHLASRDQHFAIVDTLLSSRMSIESRDREGFTPLLRALETKNWKSVEFLLSRGANLNATNSQGNGALHLAVMTPFDQVHYQTERIEFHPPQKIPNAEHLKGFRIRQLLPIRKYSTTNFSMTEWLVKHHLDVNLTNRVGQTPIDLMLQRYSYDTNRIKLFLKAGAKIRPQTLENPFLWDNAYALLVSSLNEQEATHALEALCNRPSPSSSGPQLTQTTNRIALLLKHGAKVTPTSLAGTNLLTAGFTMLIPHIENVTRTRFPQNRTWVHWAVEHYSESLIYSKTTLLPMLLDKKLDVNAKDANGLTPLHVALETATNRHSGIRSSAAIDVLVAHGAKADIFDNLGRTPAHLMAMNWPYLLEKLKDRSSLTNRDSSGNTPLHYLAQYPVPIRYLPYETFLAGFFTNSGLVNLRNANGETPLHIAMKAGNASTVLVLTSLGADASLRDKSGDTGLYLITKMKGRETIQPNTVKPPGASHDFISSIWSKDEKSFNLCLDAEPRLAVTPERFGQMPIHIAAACQFTNCVDRLIQLGASLDLLSAIKLKRDRDVERLLAGVHTIPSEWLFTAVWYDNTHAVTNLIKAGGDIKAVDGSGHSLLYRASNFKLHDLTHWLEQNHCPKSFFDVIAEGDEATVTETLKSSPQLINHSTSDLRTPLICAAAHNQTNLVKQFVGLGADINAHTPENWTALHIAAARNEVEIGKLLLAAHADPNVFAENGMAPLHIAAAYGHPEFSLLLLENGAKVNLQPEGVHTFANTPLHWAAHMGQLDTVKLLVQYGADPSSKNSSRMTPEAFLAIRPSGSYGFSSPREAGGNRYNPKHQQQTLEFLAKAAKTVKP